MNWNLLVSGKFYSSGMIYYYPQIKQFKETRDMDGPCVSKFDTNVLLNIDCDDPVNDGLLKIQFDKALAFLHSTERNFLLEKFYKAFEKCKVLCTEPKLGYAIISPIDTIVNHTSDSMFVYDISQNGNESYYVSNHIKPKEQTDNIHVYYTFEGVNYV